MPSRPIVQPGPDAARRGVQRTHPAHRPVRVGAVLEQKRCERSLPVHDRIRQDMRVVRPGFVDVDARCQQRFRHRDVAVGSGEQQWREAVGRGCTRLGAAVEQHADDLVMRPRHGPHQRGAPRRRRRRVDLCAMGHQRLDHLDAAGSRSGHQRRQAARLGAVRVGSGLEQRLDHRDTGVLGRPFERGHPMVVGSVDVRAGTQEHGGGVLIAPVGRPEQRRRPVRPRGVDIDALFDQRAHGREVLLRRGADQPQVLTGSRADAGAHDNRDHGSSNSHGPTIQPVVKPRVAPRPVIDRDSKA